MITELVLFLHEKNKELNGDLKQLWQEVYQFISTLSQEEIEEIGDEYVGLFVPVNQNSNWNQNPEIKYSYIKRIIEELIYEEFDIDYEEAVEETKLAVPVAAAEITATTVTPSSFKLKKRADLEQLSNPELYAAIVELDQKPAQIDQYLQKQFIDEYLANTIEEAVQQVEKDVLLKELDRLVANGTLEEETEVVSEPLQQNDSMTLAQWSTWYELYGQSHYGTAEKTNKLEAPNKIAWYAGLDLEIDDCYQLKGVEELQIEPSTVIISNGIDGENFVGLGRLERVQRTEDAAPIYVITWKNSELAVDMRTLQNVHYTLLVVEQKHTAALQQAVQTQSTFAHTLYRVGFDLTCEELAPITVPLCIDFGTTNTTLGCYLTKDYVPNMPQNAIALGHVHYDGYVKQDEKFDGVNFIHFYDQKAEKQQSLLSRKSYTVPTVVYVEAIDVETGEVRYQYGYEALQAVQELKERQAKKQDDRRLGSLIYGLKRWIYALEEEEEVVDELGNKKRVVRSEILKGYIDYILARATHQVKGRFTTLHFSTPVKMKAQFIEAFTKMFPNYTVKSASDAVDEGIAVLYDAISQEIAKNKESFKGRALIFDCGGGTTDLANCEYEVERDVFGDTSLTIKTKFENGNPNFGGNNLTYRIMQMLKIKLAVLYRGASTSDSIEVEDRAKVSNYLKEKEEAIATINEAPKGSDESVIEQLYAQLEKAYLTEEAYIPTEFKAYEHLTSTYVEKVRHNFYFLWDMAEAIKREFFSQLNKVTIDLNQDLRAQVGEFVLYTQQADEQLQLMSDKPQKFSFTIREIEQLIVPEIYAVEHQFLDDFKINDFMEDDIKALIKLTGQSCRIPYFRDMLKEFIPGKYIRQSKKGIDSEKQALELKLACVRGVIHFWRDEAKGTINPIKQQEAPIVPYDVLIEEPAKVMTAELALAEQNVLIAKGQEIGETTGFATIQKTATYVLVTVRNDRKQIGEARKVTLHQNTTVISTDDFEQQLISNGFPSYTDVLQRPEYRKRTLIFARTTPGTWGITLQLATFNDQGGWNVSEHYEPFEDAHAYENFFDGKH